MDGLNVAVGGHRNVTPVSRKIERRNPECITGVVVSRT